MKFTLLDPLPATVAELDEHVGQAEAEIRIFNARRDANDEFSGEDVARLEYLLESRDAINTARSELATSEQSHADKLDGLFERAKPAESAAKTDADADTAKTDDTDKADTDGGADVVAEAEQVTADAADTRETVDAATKEPVTFTVTQTDVPSPTTAAKSANQWELVSSAPNFAEFGGRKVDTAVIAAGISSRSGQFTGIRPSGPTVLAKMERPALPVQETSEAFYEDCRRIASEIPGYGKVTAETLVAAGGWCAPSELDYGFDPTQPAQGLLSFPEKRLKRGGIIINAEPDFSALQTGFHYTEPELEATTGNPPVPTAIKNIVEVPCPDTTIEYRLEAIGWGIKAGVLQRRAYPESVKKFLDEFLVEHQYRISAKSLLKVLALSSAAKVVPTDAVLGATTGILNGLHVRARNIQLKSRKSTIEGIAPFWFRDILKADLAGRDGLDVLNVTDAQVDAWLAARGIYLQYEGRWQSLTAGQPGHPDTDWWPGSVDVVLYPAGTFWRALDNVITVGVMQDITMLQQNRELIGFVEDEFQVGKTASDPSHLIRIPLCVNSAVGAREEIVCRTATITKTIAYTGGPTGGGATFKFGPLGALSTSVANNAAASAVDSALTGIDDGVTAAGDITTTGGPLPAAVTVTYPAKLGDLQVATNSLTGGTSPGVTIS